MAQGGGWTRALHAPAWLEELVRTRRPPVPWRDVVRYAVCLPAPLALAVAVEGGIEPGPTLSAGVFGTMGALVATLAPQPAPLRDQLRRTVAGTAFGMLGLLVGQYASGGGWQPVVVIALVSAAAALISQINATLSLGSLQLLVYTALASGLVTELPLAAEIGFFLAGAAWAALGTLVQSTTEALDPDRTAVAAVFRRIADLLDACGTDATDDARRGADHRAQRRLRPGDPQPQPHGRPGARALRARRRAQLRGAPGRGVGRRVAGRRTRRIRTTSPPSARWPPPCRTTASSRPDRPPPLEDGTPARRAVRHGVRLVWNVVGDPEERAGAAAVRPPVDLRTRLRDLSDRTLASPDGRAFAVRLALCMSIAEVARQFLPTGRPYWVLLTVAIVLKPDFGSVFGRAVQRGAGTLLGVLIGSALLALFPRSPWLLVAMALFAAVLPWARAANFGLFSVFQTPVIILMLDLPCPDDAGHRARAADRHPDRLRHRARLRLPALAADLAGARWTRRCGTPRSRWTRSSRPRSPAARPTGAVPAAATTARSPSCRPSCSAGWPSRRRSATAPPPGGR